MRIERDRLIFKAICALDEIADGCGSAPLKLTFAMRFALAFLFALSDGDRQPYDAFWRTVRDPCSNAYSEHNGRYLRASYARTASTRIARGVGVEMSIDFMAALARARRGNGR